METATTEVVETKQPSVAPSEPEPPQQTPVVATPITDESRTSPDSATLDLKKEAHESPDRPNTNGIKPPAPAAEDDDTANDDELTPPPENMSPVSPGIDRALEDEIVVGNRNGAPKSSPLRVVSDPEDEDMADVEDEPIVSHYPKRKRASVFNDLSEDKMESSMVSEKEGTPRATTKPARRHGLGGVKGVILGHWRDSPVPDERGKHAVIGFIDVRDRLRTRIQQNTRFGSPVSNVDYPLPPGPGGSWVTFERVVFADHLVGLDHHQVKEYVKLRTDAFEETDEARDAAEKEAAKEAIRRIEANPPPDNVLAPAIAYGVEIPDHASMPPRPDSKRRRTGSGIGTISGGPVQPQPARDMPPTPFYDPLAGTRPTRIIVGYWRGSSEPEAINRHAVYGILGQNDMFRVKVARETRDKRFVDGNFPVGAGALWIHWDEVELEPHLKGLSRQEVKEYCRVRQYQIDHGETPDSRLTNEAQAVLDARQRVQSGMKPGMQSMPPPIVPLPDDDSELLDTKSEANQELRQSRRTEARGGRHALPDPDLNGRQSSRTPIAAQNKIDASARREISRMEAAQQRTERFAADREAAALAAVNHAASIGHPSLSSQGVPKMPITNGNGPRMSAMFHERDEMQRLNKVWASQEEHRSKAAGDESKFYGGIKYERKTNGPFVGKLVSQGTIISIDGEDYVEYRVLTKPTFF